jgi:hypothetical protein
MGDLTAFIMLGVALLQYYEAFKSKGDSQGIHFSLASLWGIVAINELKKTRGCH